MTKFKTFIMIGFGFLVACSTASLQDQHLLHKLILYNLHVRRPLTPAASLNAEHGEYDYQSHPKPSANLDCQPLSFLFNQLNMRELRSCFESVSKMQNVKPVSYTLHREHAPFLKLDNPDNSVPQCIAKLLDQIAVPREIFFQSTDEGELACYSARMPLEGEGKLGIQYYLESTKVVVRLPMEAEVPKNEEEITILLGTWAVTPFVRNEQSMIMAKIATEGVCRKCLGEENVLLDKEGLPPVWP